MISSIPQVYIGEYGTLSIDRFKEMDYQSVRKYHIPVELLMENAGLNLARLSVGLVGSGSTILIGAGPGNNGGGGCVAARRLAGWGYSVSLHLLNTKFKPLMSVQLQRALVAGAIIRECEHPDLFLDAYLGFSQRVPLPTSYQQVIHEKSKLDCHKISLDLPTGFDSQSGKLDFIPNTILTLAAMKTELLNFLSTNHVYIADIGLPHQVYTDFGLKPFNTFPACGLVRCLPAKSADL